MNEPMELTKGLEQRHVVFSLLYDLNLLPEQVKEGSIEQHKMFLILAHFKMMEKRIEELERKLGYRRGEYRPKPKKEELL